MCFQPVIRLTIYRRAGFGQITGDLQINVSDQSSAAVPNASVTVRNVDTGTTRTVGTDEAGQIRVSQLDPGRYEVKVSHPGFTTVTQVVPVASGGSSTVAVTLEVSATSEQVVVEAVATPINTSNPQLQNTIETAAIKDLAQHHARWGHRDRCQHHRSGRTRHGAIGRD